VLGFEPWSSSLVTVLTELQRLTSIWITNLQYKSSYICMYTYIHLQINDSPKRFSVLCVAMKAYWEVEVYLHSFFDLSSKLWWVVSFTPLPLYPQGRIPCYPLDRRLGGPQSRFGGHGGEEKNSQPLRGLETPIIQSAAQRNTTELSQLLKRYGSLPFCVLVSGYYKKRKEMIMHLSFG
jgi:hypothetical protein